MPFPHRPTALALRIEQITAIESLFRAKKGRTARTVWLSLAPPFTDPLETPLPDVFAAVYCLLLWLS